MHFLAERGVARALMTRNSTKAAEAFLHRLKSDLTSNISQYPSLEDSEIFSQVCVYICVCMCVCMYMCMYMCVCMCVCIQESNCYYIVL